LITLIINAHLFALTPVRREKANGSARAA
jgi:hypothetical protein